MKIGGHAVLFKGRIVTDTVEILQAFKDGGFEGVEIGARFFGTERKQELFDALDKVGILMSAMHVGVPHDMLTNDPEKAKETVLAVARFLQGTPTTNIMMSGGARGEDYEIEKSFAVLEDICKACNDLGIAVNYHNHAHEFMNGAKYYKLLCEKVPSLNFGFDLGWVYKGGYDPFKAVEEQRGRLKYVHLRDFVNDKPRQQDSTEDEFVDIGTGKFDLPRMIDLLQDVGAQWAVVEYGRGEESYERYARAGQYLNKLLKK